MNEEETERTDVPLTEEEREMLTEEARRNGISLEDLLKEILTDAAKGEN